MALLTSTTSTPRDRVSHRFQGQLAAEELQVQVPPTFNMPPTTIRSAPSLDSFTSLEDHQSQTPTSFYRAKPVLHHHITGAHVLVTNDQRSKLPVFHSADAGTHGGVRSAESLTAGEEAPLQGGYPHVEDIVVDVYVSSESFIMFNTSTETGVSIPYPAIALHAVQRLPDPDSEDSTLATFGLLMNIELESQPSDEDEEPDVLEFTIVPPSTSLSLGAVQTLFAAVSTCSNLHPDPISQDDEEMGEDGDGRIMFEGSVGYEGISGLPGVARGATDGGLPPPFPGSGGWITAENVGEYFDEEGNWLGNGNEEEEALGEGAGTVRGRDEASNSTSGVNGHREDGEETQKRQRTD